MLLVCLTLINLAIKYSVFAPRSSKSPNCHSRGSNREPRTKIVSGANKLYFSLMGCFDPGSPIKELGDDVLGGLGADGIRQCVLII